MNAFRTPRRRHLLAVARRHLSANCYAPPELRTISWRNISMRLVRPHIKSILQIKAFADDLESLCMRIMGVFIYIKCISNVISDNFWVNHLTLTVSPFRFTFHVKFQCENVWLVWGSNEHFASKLQTF